MDDIRYSESVDEGKKYATISTNKATRFLNKRMDF